MHDTKKPKIIHNKKSLKKKFWGFSQNRFLSNKKPVFPLFLGHLRSDRAEIFFGDTSTNLGGILFFLLISLTNKIWQDLQNW
jgi:hypothetical protein